MNKLILPLFLCFSFLSFSQETIKTFTFQENFDAVMEFIELNNIAPERVLIVNDVDNNILKHVHHVGSDQWFRWQMNMVLKDIKSPYRVASDFNGLLEWYNIAINAPGASMSLTDPKINNVLNQFKEAGFDMMALTARGPQTAEATARELRSNLVEWSKNAPLESTYINGFIEGFERSIIYKDGLALIAGQDKGEFLKYLLEKSARSYDLIIISDDQLRNVDNVHKAFMDTSTKTLGFRYAAVDKAVKKFERMAKKPVHKEFLKLKNSCNHLLQ